MKSVEKSEDHKRFDQVAVVPPIKGLVGCPSRRETRERDRVFAKRSTLPGQQRLVESVLGLC
jgi:hypothetical protein